MTLKSWVTKILNIRSEEYKPVLLLMLFSFFIGMSITFYFTASNALFLKHFPPKMIPVSFIASGVIIYLAWWIFSHIDKKLSLYYQVTTKFLFVFLTILAISIGVVIFDKSWITFIMYTWVRVMVYITLVNFWGLAGRLFNVRQGKRIFGLIGVGEVISYMIGYFSIPLLLKVIKAAHLLFLSSGSLMICLIFVIVIMRIFKDQLTTATTPTKQAVQKTTDNWSYWKLIKKPYFQLISLMALLPIFGYLFVDFLFLAQTKKEFANNTETIASFLGLFLGFLAFIETILKFVSGRFLNKFGLKPGLVSLPVILLSSIFMAAFFGTLYGAVGLFFVFIALARLFERSVRGAVYEPAFQLLYQPVPTDMRLTFQNQIEGIPKALGTVITGAVILLVSALQATSLVTYNYFFILVLAFWIWVAFKMYEAYRNMLKNKLIELKAEQVQDADPMANLFRETLMSARPDDFDKVYRMLEIAQPVLTEELLEKTYVVGSDALKKEILHKIRNNQMIPALRYIHTFTEYSGTEELKQLVAETTEFLKNQEQINFEAMTEQCRSADVSARLHAARLLGYSARYNTYKLLLTLIRDPNPAVRRAGIISCGKIKRVELWPYIIENLANPEFAATAVIALRQIGEPVLKDVDRYFEKMNGSPSTQLRIIRLYESIDGPKSIKLLRDKMFHPDKDVRNQVLFSLSIREYHAVPSEISTIKDIVEETVEYIIWIQASLHDLRDEADAFELKISLLSELEEKKEHVFLLLSLLYESRTIRHIREYIESKDPTARVYALEIGDMIIADDIKELFFPVFEDLSIQERISRFSARFPQEELSPVRRLYDIINKPFAQSNLWSKVCAIQLLGLQPRDENQETEIFLAANLVHPESVLGEIAAWTLYNYNQVYYLDTVVRFEKKEYPGISDLAAKIKERAKDSAMLIVEKATVIKNSELFTTVSETEIIQMLKMYPDLRILKDGTSYHPVNELSEYENIVTPEGSLIQVPGQWLQEFMNRSAGFTEKYFRSINNHI